MHSIYHTRPKQPGHELSFLFSTKKASVVIQLSTIVRHTRARQFLLTIVASAQLYNGFVPTTSSYSFSATIQRIRTDNELVFVQRVVSPRKPRLDKVRELPGLLAVAGLIKRAQRQLAQIVACDLRRRKENQIQHWEIAQIRWCA
jgi:hypothetical protein